MDTTIVLIGPPGAGKTTVAPLLAKRLGRPVIDLDTERWAYYAEIGYRHDHAQWLVEEQGLEALIAYWKPFELYAVERVLSDHTGSIIAFGAGHSVYDDATQFARVHSRLARCQHVVLIMPTPDRAQAIQHLNARLPIDDPHRDALMRIHDQLITNHSNEDLATITVYTEGKTPEDTCEDILHQMGAGVP
ncbi:MAG TPA: shikimate kinase [Roseiflexaceae bacterium]|nr:shikimate kinase [Roseiflexaceae bacterium]